MIYKLKYTDKESAVADLIAKGVIVENDKGFLNNADNTHAIVYVGDIIDLDGYHVDVMIDQVIEFNNALNPNNPKHTFAGW